MARLLQTGVAISSLHEREITLPEIISKLKLPPLSDEDETEVRSLIGVSIGMWWRVRQHHFPEVRLQVEHIVSSLTAIAKHLDACNEILAAANDGRHDVHNLEVVGRLTGKLQERAPIGSVEAALAYLSDFREQSIAVALTATAAAMALKQETFKDGQPKHDWYDEFVRAVLFICTRNSVSAELRVDHDKSQGRGRIFEIATELEGLLHKDMRSSSSLARGKRLRTSLQRLNNR